MPSAGSTRPAKPETNLKLLLIDDEEVIHRSVGEFLKKMGYQVQHAHSARQGLELRSGQRERQRCTRACFEVNAG